MAILPLVRGFEGRCRAYVARRSIFAVAEKDCRMFDLLFLAIGFGFFAVATLYVVACERF
ncbi:MAG: hypothetical protein ACLQIQ_19535 [Beijerinckiaceae bacterium]